MSRSQFDADAFYATLDAQRQSQGLTWKKVADESGVSASTLTRMAQGRRPDVDSFAALLSWSGLSADSFIRTEGENSPQQADTLAQVTAQFRADPNLPQEAREAIEATIKVLYDKFRQDKKK